MSFWQLKTNTMRNSRITTIVLVVLFISTLSFAQKTIDKVFSGVKTINLSTASGNGYVKRSNNNEVKVTLEYTFDDEDYKPSFEQDGDRLVIKEKFENSRWNRGYAKWTLEVPNGMELEFKTGSGNIEVDGVDMDILAKSGSGNIEVSDLSGVMRINTGSGDIDLSNVKGQSKGNTGSGNITLSRVEGDSDFNTGSGNIRARGISGAVDFNTGSGNIELIDVEIKGRSRINTGSGNAELELSSQLEHDVELSTGSGNATLDFNGTTIAGVFRMEASSKNDIRAPFEFNRVSDRESGRSNGKRYTKEAKIGNKNIEIIISTGSGVSQVKK
ncbi:MAG: hypothetical protein ACJAXX_000448 [Roseivirga sp.]|jgi:hypothetical protein